MRRADRQTTEDEARALLSSGEYGVLSTVSPAGVPYGVPISYAFHNGEILFHSAPEGQKLDNLIPGSLASFCVVGKTEVIPEKFSTRYQSAIVHGQVRELLGPEKIRALAVLVEKYSPAFPSEGADYIAASESLTRVFALKAARITGKQRL